MALSKDMRELLDKQVEKLTKEEMVALLQLMRQERKRRSSKSKKKTAK